MSTLKVIAGVLVGAAITGGGIWLSQNTPNFLSKPKAPQGQLFEGWVLNCSNEVKKCSLSQTLMDSKSNQRVANISIGNLGPKGESFMLLNAPLGIVVAAGVAYKIDEQEQVGVPVQHCTPDGCHAALPMSTNLQKALANGKVLRLGVLAPDRQSLSLEFNLKGFKEGLEAYHEKVTAFGPVNEITKVDTKKLSDQSDSPVDAEVSQETNLAPAKNAEKKLPPKEQPKNKNE